MIVFTRFRNKKRAVSPVIAVILLIGLAVAAVAVIFVVVLPMLEPTSKLEMNDAYIEYDDTTTTAADVGEGYGKGTLILSNTGTGDIEIDSLQVFYGSSLVGPWEEIENHKLTISGHAGAITGTNPYILETLAVLDEITVGFPIPEENDNDTISYKITITSSEGASFDTSTQANVAATDMQLSKDRPDISFIGTSLDNLRRIESEKIRPSGIGDNSGSIKNVIYRVYSDPGGNLVQEKTIPPPSSLWTWVWDTRYDIAKGLDEGLPNGTYNMTMTVSDYAGLSKTTQRINFTIDNDYTPPTINYIDPEAPWAEVGESYTIIANVVDTGCAVSQVEDVWLHYKLVNETSYRQPIRMDPLLGDNYSDSIPIDAKALEVDLTYYIEAIDHPLDDNHANSSVSNLEANDTKLPNIYHTSLVEEVERSDITVIAQVEDPGLVNTSNVILYTRKANDLNADVTVAGESLPSSWISITPTMINFIDNPLTPPTWNFTWDIPQPYYNVTIHGLDYYINATDRYGENTAQLGPFHIDVLDLNPADFVGISSSDFPSSWTENSSYPISVQVSDNDPTFGRIVNGDMSTYATGMVTIHFKKWNGDPGQAFAPSDINQTVHLSGNSSIGEITTWFGVIPKIAFAAVSNPRVDFYITVDDQSSTDQDQHGVVPTRWPESGYYSVEVKEAGQPSVIYSPYSVGLKNNNETVVFMVNNSASGASEEAHATLTEMYLEIYSSDWDFSNGKPNLTKVLFTRWVSSDSYNDTAGSPRPWGGNDSWVTFDSENPGTVRHDNDYNIIELTFSNTSGGFIDMHNMVLNVSFKAKVTGVDVDDQWLGMIPTPGVEPQSSLFSPYNAGANKYYINEWLISPLYPYASSGLGWDTESEEPWTGSYSRADVSSGQIKPYDGFSVAGGSGTHTTNTWVHLPNNDVYRMNIDSRTGGATNQYLWFYAVILIPGGDTSVTMYLGSDDEAVCYINGQLAGSYGSPRGYGETPFTVDLLGNNQNNYILFGVHEDAGGYYGGLAFQIVGGFQIKIYTGPPPPPLGSPIQLRMTQSSETILLSTLKVEMISNPASYCFLRRNQN